MKFRRVTVTSWCADEVLTVSCNEQCEMSVEVMDVMSLDGIARLICAFINTSHCMSATLSHSTLAS